MTDPTPIDPNQERVHLVREFVRLGYIDNLYLYAFECPDMEEAALQVAREQEVGSTESK